MVEDVRDKEPSRRDSHLYRYKIRLDFIQAICAMIFTSGVAVAIPAAVDAYKASLDLRKSQAELDIKSEENKSQRLQAFLAQAINQDIEIRLRLTEYFSFVSDQPELQKWQNFHQALLDRREKIKNEINKLTKQLVQIRKKNIDEEVQGEIDETERLLDWNYGELGYIRKDATVAPSPRALLESPVNWEAIGIDDQTLFESVQLDVEDSEQKQIQSVVARIEQDRKRYETIENATQTPWYLVAIIHQMETGGRFDMHLNGNPLSGRTVSVPAGLPRDGQPPFTWEQSTIAFMRFFFTTRTKPTSGSILASIEKWNGLTFRRRGMPAPFLWRCTNQDTHPAFPTIGMFNSVEITSKRCGAAAILKILIDKKDVFL